MLSTKTLSRLRSSEEPIFLKPQQSLKKRRQFSNLPSVESIHSKRGPLIGYWLFQYLNFNHMGILSKLGQFTVLGLSGSSLKFFK